MALISSRKLTSGNLSVVQKLYLIIGFCIAMTCAVAGYGIYQLNAIGQEIASIAEDDVPLTNIVSEVTVEQLEQSILLERMLRYAGIQGEGKAELLKLEKEIKKFGAKTSKALEKGIKQANESIVHASAAGNHEALTEFKSVKQQLEKIQSSHKVFDSHVAEIIAAIDQGKTTEIAGLAKKLTREETELNHAAEALLAEVEKFTLHAATQAEAHEKTALVTMIIFTIVGAAVGWVVAWWVLRTSVSQPLAEVVRELKQPAEGDTSATVSVYSNDEIGQVAKAFETFKAKSLEMQRLEAEKREADQKAEEERREATAREEKRKQEEEKRLQE